MAPTGTFERPDEASVFAEDECGECEGKDECEAEVAVVSGEFDEVVDEVVKLK